MTDDPRVTDPDYLLKWLPSVYDGRMYQEKSQQRGTDAVTDIHQKIAKASGRKSNDTARTLALAAIRDGEAWNDRRLPEMGRALNAALNAIDSLAANAARAQDAEAKLATLRHAIGPEGKLIAVGRDWIKQIENERDAAVARAEQAEKTLELREDSRVDAAHVAHLIDRAEQAERALRYALDCIESPDAEYASGKDIYDAAMMRKAIVRARAALAARSGGGEQT